DHDEVDEPSDHIEIHDPSDEAEAEDALDEAQAEEELDAAQAEEELGDAQAEEALDEAKAEEALDAAQAEEELDDAQAEEALDAAQAEEALDEAQAEEELDAAQADEVSEAQADAVFDEAQAAAASDEALMPETADAAETQEDFTTEGAGEVEADDAQATHDRPYFTSVTFKDADDRTDELTDEVVAEDAAMLDAQADELDDLNDQQTDESQPEAQDGEELPAEASGDAEPELGETEAEASAYFAGHDAEENDQPIDATDDGMDAPVSQVVEAFMGTPDADHFGLTAILGGISGEAIASVEEPSADADEPLSDAAMPPFANRDGSDDVPAFESETGDEEWSDIDSVRPAIEMAEARQARSDEAASPAEDEPADTPQADDNSAEAAAIALTSTAVFSRALRRDAMIDPINPQEPVAPVFVPAAQTDLATDAAAPDTPEALAEHSEIDAPSDADQPDGAGAAPDTGADTAPLGDIGDGTHPPEQAGGRPGLADEDYEPEQEAAEALASLDEVALRELVAQVVREELQGALGQRITRNVRKMVRREIRLALVAEDYE
ncbi:MAG: hypothetical protein AAGA70_18660, partial [Pseudomonadota bacterium]